MQREKAQFDILDKIRQERIKRNWTDYMLAKNSGFTQSTISSWYRKNLQPSVASIEKVCAGLGITLSEFFDDQTSSPEKGRTPEEVQLCNCYRRLNKDQREAVLNLLRMMNPT